MARKASTPTPVHWLTLDMQGAAPPPQRRLRRRGVSPLAIAGPLIAIIVLVAIASFYPWSHHPGTTPVKTSALTLSTGHAPTTLGVCLDGTASTQPTFVKNITSALGAQLAQIIAIPSKTLPNSAQPGFSGLRLLVRPVTTTSFATSSPYLDLTIPSVSPLSAPPSATDPTYAQDFVTWTTDEGKWAAALAAAHAAALAADATVLNFNVAEPANVNSAIYGCVSALSNISPGSPILLASDLENNEPPILTNLDKSSVTIIQSCPPATEYGCSTLATAFVKTLHRMNAGRVSVVRPENVQQIVHSLLGVN